MNRIALFFLKNPWHWLAFGLLVVISRGLFLDVMDVDASQYASISMEMLQRGEWLQVMHRGANYLDKPPLLFWTSAASFGLFGLSNWAYKLPSVLTALASVYAVFRFSKLFYTEKTARQAAFIFASSVGFLVLCNDVRTDTLLLATTTCAVWQIAEYLQFKRFLNWLCAFLFVGLAMLAKGPIGLVMPAFAVGTHLLLQRDWRNLFRWEWLAGLLIVGLVLAPMCWGLYHQFDLHPETKVNGRTGVSGLYFFFWEQSFGRITGENTWKNDTSGFYFLHVYLWAFLPWVLLLAGAGWQGLSRLGKGHILNLLTPSKAEAYSLGGFLLTFIALSLSKYKLPHYIFITLPWAAILVARWLNPTSEEEVPPRSRKVGLLYFPILAVALATFLLLGFVFPTYNLLLWGIALAIFGSLAWRIFKNPFPVDSDVLVQRGVLAVVGGMLVLNFHFYPNLLPYQSTSAVAQYAQKNGIPAEKMAFYWRHGHALDFYSRRILPEIQSLEHLRSTADSLHGCWIYTSKEALAKLDTFGIPYTIERPFNHFQVALLSPQFLNSFTRDRTLSPVFLAKIPAKQK